MGGFWDSFWDKACDAVDVVEKHTMDKLDEIDHKMDYTFDEINRQVDKVQRINKYNSFEDNMDILFESKKDVNANKYSKRKAPKIGDIVGVIRDFYGISYEHYGVYSGIGRVIHYTGTENETTCIIRETSFEEFLRIDNDNDNTKYFLFDCEGICEKKDRVSGKVYESLSQSLLSSSIVKALPKIEHVRELYSSSETVSRAKSRLGENAYNVLLNNCEHFAIWCKTGVHVSHQVNPAILGDKYWKTYKKEYIYG